MSSARATSTDPGDQQPQPAVLRTVVALIHGELDIATAGYLHETLSRIARGRGRIVIDARGVSFVDLAGLRALCSAYRSITAGGTEAIIVPSDCLTRLLALAEQVGFSCHLPIERSSDSVGAAEWVDVALSASPNHAAGVAGARRRECLSGPDGRVVGSPSADASRG